MSVESSCDHESLYQLRITGLMLVKIPPRISTHVMIFSRQLYLGISFRLIAFGIMEYISSVRD